jgi:type I restriction-modification system DNA methylase subunit
MDKETSKRAVEGLVEKYKKVLNEGNVSKYNEEMTKKDFILPLFRCLGWDVENSSEVTAEEKVSKKRVDYSFRINGIPKFFLEAKSLKEQLDKDNYRFYKQAVEYSWYKGCTWAVLTDFEHMRILNAEVKSTNPLQSQFRWIDYNEYLTRFEELWLLSKESFEQGLLDKEADRLLKRTKKQKVDQQLLADFTVFRETLSKNITKLNQSRHLTEEELDEAIQRILDRLIFIRNCEDRELEEKRLWEAKNEIHVWKKVKEIFAYYDRNYDSKLFTYDPNNPKLVHLCDTLDIDDDVIGTILNGLYRTKDDFVSYDFSAIDADVLGTVYEQYLGHILKKTEKRASLSENHVHKKEQGIYYTPTYIVDYIVRKALGELLKEKKTDLENIKVLDPACGSGSFLIKTFDVLNEYYERNMMNYSQTQLDVKTGIPFTTKVRILQNSIFGVDLDKQAVEITQLNLLLKIAEKGHRLPLLERNIRCGNSLVDDEKLAGDKAFKWEEQFSEIMREGGFDVVIGNPPYVRQEELSEIKPYLEANYETYQGTADLFVYFFEKELKILKEDGYFGMIVSNKWLRAGYGKKLRKFLTGFWIEEFIDFGDLRVFADATIYPCVMIMRKIKKPNPKIRICKMETLRFGSLGEYVRNNSFFIDQSELNENEWNIQKTEANELLKKIRSSGLPIEEYVGVKIYRGIVTGLNEAFEIDKKKRDELIDEDSRNEELIKPFLTGAESKRYSIRSKNKYVIFTRRGIDILQYPSVLRYLEQFKKELSPKKGKEQEIGRKPGKYEWFEIQDSTAYYRDFEKPKIVWGNLAKRSSFSLDETNGFYVNNPANILPTNSRYVLGILNSKLMSYFLKSICAERQGGFIEQKPVYVSQVPIKKPTKEQEIEMTQHVEKMLQLNEKLLKIGDKLTDERTRLEEEMKRIDAEIDNLVYEIYGLTDDEKKIIENSLK